jgi:hypothetical protein
LPALGTAPIGTLAGVAGAWQLTVLSLIVGLLRALLVAWYGLAVRRTEATSASSATVPRDDAEAGATHNSHRLAA